MVVKGAIKYQRLRPGMLVYVAHSYAWIIAVRRVDDDVYVTFLNGFNTSSNLKFFRNHHGNAWERFAPGKALCIM